MHPSSLAARGCFCVILLAAGWLLGPTPGLGIERVVLATNWKAQPEHGGFYQSLVDGEYERAGLQVEIRPGGPLINHRPLLALGKVDFLIGTNLLQPFAAVQQQIPTRVVAAFFQRDPQCLIAHPDQGYQEWSDLTRAPLLMSNSGRHSFFLWMKAVHGFRSEQLRPYNHSLIPFLTNKSWIQQGYATAEPMRVAEVLGREPLVFLLADHGWQSYSTVLEAHDRLIAEKPELVQRFVNASILGWIRYLHADNSAANARIKADNRAMTDAQIDYSLKKMRSFGLVDSGDAQTRGVGGMDADRIRTFYRTMTEAGLYREGEIDPDQAYTLQFVNRGYGIDESRRLDSEHAAATDANAPAGSK
jgi:NitT/TauT family transport system substrate-binding protein